MLKKVLILLYIISLKFLQIFKKEDAEKYLLIIKPDAIGDYILFRNFLCTIAKSDQYANFKLILVGDEIWKDLAFEVDRDIIHDFISVNSKKADWFKLCKDVSIYKYDTIITFHYSRFIVTETAAFLGYAKHKIAMQGDVYRISPALKFFSDKIYTRLIAIPDHIESEFEINKIFTEKILNKEVSFNTTSMVLKETSSSLQLPDGPFVVIALGAAVKNRQISLSAAKQIISFISKRYLIVLVGSRADIVMINQLKEQIPGCRNRLVDFTGKTSIAEIPFIVNKSSCVVCVESGLFHISVALNKPTLCIAGGGHFKRFVEYALTPTKQVVVSYKKMHCFNCNWVCKYKFPIDEPYPCIKEIDLTKVFNDFLFLDNTFVKTNN